MKMKINSDYINYNDTIYWDFLYKDVKFTIHLEHYTGIFIFTFSFNPSKKEINVLNELKLELKKYFNSN